jgi:hypothetical protein
MHLFVIYIGGRHAQSLIELHDMRFVVAETLEDTYPALRRSWWGEPASLHVDCWGILREVDGYALELATQASDSAQQVYFANLGGYDPSAFTELHHNTFVVAPDLSTAKAKALKQVGAWQSPHRDYIYTLESLVDLHALVAAQGFYLQLQPTALSQPFSFVCQYTPIAR